MNFHKHFFFSLLALVCQQNVFSPSCETPQTLLYLFSTLRSWSRVGITLVGDFASPYYQIILWHCRELSCLNSCLISAQQIYKHNTCSCHLQTFTDDSSIDNEEQSGDRKLVLDPVFWHGLEQPAAEKKTKKKRKQKHRSCGGNVELQRTVRTVISQKEVVQSDSSINNLDSARMARDLKCGLIQCFFFFPQQFVSESLEGQFKQK